MQRCHVFVWAGLVLAASWLSLALLDPRGGTGWRGYFLGSLFAHATLAAAWPVFGPGPLMVRVPLAIAWAISWPVAIAINVAVHGGPDHVVLTLGACLVGQWLLLLVPFAGIALGFGLRLRRAAEVENGADGKALQFGIRDLLIAIAICSILLALGRIIVPNISLRAGNELQVFLFLAVAAIVMTFPLLLAALLQRKSQRGILMSLMLIAVATASEFPLMETLGGMRGPTRNDFIAINVASAVLILLVAGVVRLNGYCLFIRRVAKEA